MKRENFSDAAALRRGFYSCHEEHEGLHENLEMGRKISVEKESVLPKKISHKRRIHKKIRIIRKQLKRAFSAERRRRIDPIK